VQVLENGYRGGKRVTLVSAPAGFGKTTIIREWLKSTKPGKPFGWLSLDEGDNDPVRFLILFSFRYSKVNTKIGQTILAALNSSQFPASRLGGNTDQRNLNRVKSFSDRVR